MTCISIAPVLIVQIDSRPDAASGTRIADKVEDNLLILLVEAPTQHEHSCLSDRELAQ